MFCVPFSHVQLLFKDCSLYRVADVLTQILVQIGLLGCEPLGILFTCQEMISLILIFSQYKKLEYFIGCGLNLYLQKEHANSLVIWVLLWKVMAMVQAKFTAVCDFL